ncbi:MAG: hypothetical protein QM749_03470 [Aquabacterium sp.]
MSTYRKKADRLIDRGVKCDDNFHIPDCSPNLSSLEIANVSRRIREKKSSKEDAESLLRQFVYEAYKGGNIGINRELILHLRDAIQTYLDDGINLEIALGLKKAKGRPKVKNSSQKTLWATMILKSRLRGETYENAIAEVVQQVNSTGCSKTSVESAWQDSRNEALPSLTIERRKASISPLYSDTEVALLKSMFPDFIVDALFYPEK